MALGPKISPTNNRCSNQENTGRYIQNPSNQTFSSVTTLNQQDNRHEIAQKTGSAPKLDPMIPRKRELHFLSEEWAEEFSDLWEISQ
eukprot:CAMPEP_0183292032 /NCGR_PEP_ID=MMETSP0160_2-20130417/1254_1 /TAXON_ID=2839 ORGANISM="Odontella Sinensis, Strain Grunow 1884" /NCGR_SAMPLE_ID=MMETSP0160_2 /ASSEMBLY_ACC=CAM_ASM_000250 /LENGTH=86 /DNA_ID=CAMNT_0025452939 /DNA_START=24 /DNA_END=284 /DNA_ORIENTATION=+